MELFFQRLKGKWDKLPVWLRNPYVLTVMIFFIWMTLFDSNSVIRQVKLQLKLANLEEQKVFLDKETARDIKFNSDVMGDKNELERFAREKYFMKRDCEDLYIIVVE